MGDMRISKDRPMAISAEEAFFNLLTNVDKEIIPKSSEAPKGKDPGPGMPHFPRPRR